LSKELIDKYITCVEKLVDVKETDIISSVQENIRLEALKILLEIVKLLSGG